MTVAGNGNAGDEVARQRALVASLADALGARMGTAVARIETHISHVLVAGDSAWKIKKPLRLAFVDYGTLERRRACCDEELRLNRRLAPGLYRDVVAITGPRERPEIDGPGEVLDYAVHMRAFAQSDLLSSMLERGALRPAHVDELARIAAAFHERAPRAPADSRFGTPERVLADALANFDALEGLGEAGDATPALRAWTRAEFASCEQAIEARRREGAVRECHGDLHLGNVALVDGRVTVFDCIEFNPDLRWIDVMAEAAFATMDLADRGRDDHAWRFLNAWLEATGDYGGVAVLRFHLVYRAMVRAKVRFLRAAQVERAPERERIRDEAGRYVALARRLAHDRLPAIVVTHGVAGSGKTTVTQALLEALPAIRVRTDVERKRLHGLRADDASGSAPDAGLYAAAATERTYDRVADVARAIASAGYAALVDGTFLRRAQRDRLRAVAAELRVPFGILDLAAPDALLRERVAARAARGGDASEATLAVLDRQLRTREPLRDDERACAIAVDATRPPGADVVRAVRRAIAPESAGP